MVRSAALALLVGCGSFSEATPAPLDGGMAADAGGDAIAVDAGAPLGACGTRLDFTDLAAASAGLSGAEKSSMTETEEKTLSGRAPQMAKGMKDVVGLEPEPVSKARGALREARAAHRPSVAARHQGSRAPLRVPDR